MLGSPDEQKLCDAELASCLGAADNGWPRQPIGFYAAAQSAATIWSSSYDDVLHVAIVDEEASDVVELVHPIKGGPTDWKSNKPCAGYPAAAGTSPTGWYTHNDAHRDDDTQNIAFIGKDLVINVCSSHMKAPGWQRFTLGHAHKGTSPTSWYTKSNDVQSIAYVSEQQEIQRYFQHLHPSEGQSPQWQGDTPGAKHRLVAPDTSPTSWHTPCDGAQHIAYVSQAPGDVDQPLQISELYNFLSDSTDTWKHAVISDGQPGVAAGTSPTSWYTPGDKVQHVVYIGEDGLVHELYQFMVPPKGETSEWQHRVLNAGQPRAMTGALLRPTSWYTPDADHVAYLGADGSMHECFCRIGQPVKSRVWEHATIADVSGPRTKLVGGPTGWYTESDKTQQVVFMMALIPESRPEPVIVVERSYMKLG